MKEIKALLLKARMYATELRKILEDFQEAMGHEDLTITTPTGTATIEYDTVEASIEDAADIESWLYDMNLGG